jgi:hypothetical protein
MPKGTSLCQSPGCGATNPHVHSKPIDDLPSEVQEKLRELGLSGRTLWECTHCSGIWIERAENNRGTYRSIDQVGVKNIGTPSMSWPILDRKPRS